MNGSVEETRRQLVIDELRPLLNQVSLPAADLRLGGGSPVSVTGSYLAGHPYLPEGVPWPRYNDVPMFCVAQVNFTDVGPLPGFPSTGLFQWFVAADSLNFGLTYDETGGKSGFEVRWYSDTTARPVAPPTAPTPWHKAGDEPEVYAPFRPTEARGVTFTVGSALPQLAEFTPDDQGDLARLVRELAKLNGERGDHPGDLLHNGWNFHVLGIESPFRETFVFGSSVGGSASFRQEDARSYPNYPSIGEPAGQVLVTIDQDVAQGWGDSGIAHLFGDPADLARGDLRSVHYYWDSF
ncbi:DUF1963 domain-containing protein [Amycolatopsis japonica]|uniref:DUF1963 domain-containing protein n=1 Tax=Amycolatopsis TaxID=1813 RepID=UPI0009DE0D85|nr:DUF1963 domain-containing protein [Amycolatopsis sp. MJM2582]